MVLSFSTGQSSGTESGTLSEVSVTDSEVAGGSVTEGVVSVCEVVVSVCVVVVVVVVVVMVVVAVVVVVAAVVVVEAGRRVSGGFFVSFELLSSSEESSSSSSSSEESSTGISTNSLLVSAIEGIMFV